MDNRNLEKAMDIYAKLITGEQVSQEVNGDLYETYTSNAEVYDLLDIVIKKSNLKLYEYKDALYVTAGPGNRVFGYTNDQLKKEIGLRLNKELFLAYHMIFETILLFYKSSADMPLRSYVKNEDVLEAVTAGLSSALKKTELMSLTEVEEDSFKQLALLWDELPITAQNEDDATMKAARGSKIGFIKLVFNFLKSQDLFFEVGNKYYPTPRFEALVENYYEDCQSRLFEIARGGSEDATY